MKRRKGFGLVLDERERQAMLRLAEVEGGLSQAALVRRLVRKAAMERGLWPVSITKRDKEETSDE